MLLLAWESSEFAVRSNLLYCFAEGPDGTAIVGPRGKDGMSVDVERRTGCRYLAAKVAL